MLPTLPVVVVGLHGRRAVLDPGPDDRAVEGDLLSLDDTSLDEPDHRNREDLDDPLGPHSLSELVEGRPVGNPVDHLALDTPLEIQDDEPFLMLPEEANQVDDTVHAEEIHQEDRLQDRAGRVALRAVPPRPVRVDDGIYVREVVVLEEQAGGERFLPNWFRFLVLLLLRLTAEKLIRAGIGSSPIPWYGSSQNDAEGWGTHTHPKPIRLTKA